MNNKLIKIFGKDKNIVIGAIHFPPLLGFPDFPGFELAIDNALADLKSFEEGGVDAIVIENNYDIPHTEIVGPEIIASLTYLGEKVVSATKLPVGISVLWNDYKTALSISKVLGLKFIRIPVFVDKVETSYGIIEGHSKDATDFRSKIQADDVALFTDIHVKHAKLLSSMNIVESAKKAIEDGSDCLILTGRWTGEAPDTKELEQVRNAIGDFPMIGGSGTDSSNVKELFKYLNGAIVSTSLKDGANQKEEVNIKPYSKRILKEKVEELVKETR